MTINTTRLILEKIEELGEITIDILLPKHPKSRLARNLLGLDSYPKIKRQTISSILCRLKAQNLVERHGHKKRSSWSITPKGLKYLKDAIVPVYPKKDGVPRLVIFDIPEKERKKRDTIRFELVAHGFKQLQKSVWIGFAPLTSDFIESLDYLNLKNKVHIFSVKDFGTINL